MGPPPIQDAHLDRRVVRIEGELDDDEGNAVIRKLLYLRLEEPDGPITIELDSPGGSVVAAFAIVDVMRSLGEISTRCVGQAHGTAALILACGAPGRREARRTASIEFSPLWGDARSEADKAVFEAESVRLERAFIRMLTRVTGMPDFQAVDLLSAEHVLDAPTARSMNLIDRIVD